MAANSRALDFLDVKYVFSPQELSGLALVDREPRALLYRRATAWPRAFFTDKVETFDSLAALAQRIREGAPGPFVAVDRSDREEHVPRRAFRREPKCRRARRPRPATTALPPIPRASRSWPPPRGSSISEKSTSRATSRVSVNGRPTPYFAANYAFKAVAIPGPGTYRITFSYWPAHLTLFLAIAATGAVLWIGAMVFFWLRLRRTAGSFARVAAQTAWPSFRGRARVLIVATDSTSVTGPCIVCGSPRVHYEFSLGDFRVEQCSVCKLMRLNPQPGDKQLGEIYGSQYFIMAARLPRPSIMRAS